MITPAAIPARLRTLTRTAPATVASALRTAPARVRHGRPAILALRGLAALIQAEAVLHSGAGPAPVTGTLAGIGTWLVITGRADLAPASQP